MTPDRLSQIRERARYTLALEPLPPGENDGLVSFPGSDQLAIDTHGHTGFAAFVSNAQVDVLELVAEVLRLRGELYEIAADQHYADCVRLDSPSLGCDCHQSMASEALSV